MRPGHDATTMRPHRSLKMSVLAVTAGLFAAGPAAAEGFYIGVHGGLTFTDYYSVDDPLGFFGSSIVTDETGYAVGLTAGYAFRSDFRLELETTYRKFDNDPAFSGLPNDTIGIVTALGNVYYDFDFGSNLTPYVGVGLGFAFFDDGSSVTNSGIGAQLGAGIGFAVTDTLTASVDYRLMQAGTDYSFLGSPDRDYVSNNIWLGLRHGF